MKIEDLEKAAAKVINGDKFKADDKPMTAEERLDKYGMIPTRVEMATGTWEIIDGYNGSDTLVGFRARNVHPFGPLDNHNYAIVMTVGEWYSVCDAMDIVMSMMKL